MNQLCVTGATGFLGRHLTAAALSRSDLSLRLLSRRAADLGGMSADRVEVLEGDLLNPQSLEGFATGGSTLLHLAYLPQGRSANLDAAGNIARAAVKAGVKRVVHCSTAVVVGFAARGIVTETTAPHPRGEYQETKYDIEQLLRRELAPDVELAILRPTEIIGPGGQGLRGMIRRLAEGPEVVNAAYRLLLKHRRFNYVGVDNVVAALLLLAKTPAVQNGEVYHVSEDDDPDNRYAEVEGIVRSAVGRRSSLPDLGVPAGMLPLLFRLMPGSAPPDRTYSSSKLESIGYRKTRSLRSTILEVVAHEAGRPVASTRREESSAK